MENGEAVNQEKLPMANLNLPQRLEQITSSGVDKVICGGIDGFCLNQLGNNGVEIVHDVIGEAEVVFNLFMRGRLRPGLCCEGKEANVFVVGEKAHLGRKTYITDFGFLNADLGIGREKVLRRRRRK